MHAGATVRGSLFEDAGDGDGPSRLTTLSGGMEGEVLTLRRTVEGDLSVTREVESVVVLGLGEVTGVEGARDWNVRDGAVRLTLEADWNEVRIVRRT